MYRWQREDALADWNRANAYNHPLEQMNRLRQAGLNPHLVYGKGADATAPSIRSVSPAPSSKMAPMWDSRIVDNSIAAYQNARMISAQTDNIAQQTAIGKQEELLKQAQTAHTISSNAKTDFDLRQAQQLNDAVVLRANLENEKLDTSIDLMLNEDARQELANSTNVTLTLNKILTEQEHRVSLQLKNAMAPAEMAKLEAEIKQIEQARQNAQAEGLVKKYDALLLAQGYDRRDPAYFRMMFMLLQKGSAGRDSLRNDLQDYIRENKGGDIIK